MSKRHHATRRRIYGRRQHELHQRLDHGPVAIWLDEPDAELEPASGPGSELRPTFRPGARDDGEARTRWPHLVDSD